MSCRLCLQEKPLVNSHIIPEWCYKPLYDSDHRFVVMPLDAGVNRKYHQKGIREPLLCSDCDGKIGVWEKYVSEVFNGGVYITITQGPGQIVLGNIDYKKYKLFLMSLLWRAGISSLHFFDSVALGPHADILRHHLLDDRPGEPFEYGCVPAILLTKKLREPTLRELILEPDRGYYWGYQGYRFVLAGVLWTFIVARHSSSFPKRQWFPQKDGRVTFGLVDADEAPFMHQLSNRVRSNKIRGNTS